MLPWPQVKYSNLFYSSSRLMQKHGWRYSERDLVEEVEGIVYINSLELPSDDESTASGRSFCPLTSYCSHDCANNTFRTRFSRIVLRSAEFLGQIPGFHQTNHLIHSLSGGSTRN